MRKIPGGEKFEEEYDKMGISKHNLATDAGEDQAEKQRRWIEAKRHFRDSNTWVITLASAIASVLSAAAAWTAVLFSH